ncbi:MAG: GNAT family N-acetyltransferase [Actinobacteria bacterium]|nr:GNAT family N-acetyltransferase [Actinomycetota bacterium]
MPSMPTGARLARTSDVDDIAAVQVRAWHQAYAGVLPESVLADLDPMHLASAWASGILNPPTTRHRLIVAIDGTSGADTVVGYAAIGPSSDPDCIDNPGTAELLALVVDPDYERQGHGSRLMAAAVEYLRADGSTEANTWVPVLDEPRRAFLLSCGWGPDSAYRDIEAEGRIIREVRLATVLG